ncbi:MAG: sensor histidine kinase [Ruminococcus sp.]|jgi:signal transduction histidine kinase
MEQKIWAAAAIFLMGALFIWALYCCRSKKRLVRQILQMLEDAAEGRFREKRLDESECSMVENSMGKYLSSREAEIVGIQREKEEMQSQISDISHQAILPISNILLYTQLLEEQLGTMVSEEKAEERDEIKEALEAIRDQAGNLDSLLERLVKLSRLETGIIHVEKKQQSIGLLMETVGKQFAERAKQKDISLEVKTAEYSGVFDMKWTVEALSNLVDNALKYTPAGGKVLLCAEQLTSLVRLDVSDTGIGIAEEEQARIFGRFYRSSQTAQEPGVGIGLYIAREIMKAQNGYIRVSSKKGKGSTFSLYLLRKEISRN